jgi:hypothetical protein
MFEPQIAQIFADEEYGAKRRRMLACGYKGTRKNLQVKRIPSAVRSDLKCDPVFPFDPKLPGNLIQSLDPSSFPESETVRRTRRESDRRSSESSRWI